MQNVKIVHTAWENPNVMVYCHVRKNATNLPQIHKIIFQNIKYAYDLINLCYNDTNVERMQTGIQKENFQFYIFW